MHNRSPRCETLRVIGLAADALASACARLVEKSRQGKCTVQPASPDFEIPEDMSAQLDKLKEVKR